MSESTENVPRIRSAKQIAIAVVQRGTEFLVGLRPDGVPLAGYHEFPGGKVREGESSEAAAVRECLEETGLSVRVIDEYDATEFDYEHGPVALRFFRCEVDGENRLEPDGSFRWVPKEELGKCRFPEANAALLKELERG